MNKKFYKNYINYFIKILLHIIHGPIHNQRIISNTFLLSIYVDLFLLNPILQLNTDTHTKYFFFSNK